MSTVSDQPGEDRRVVSNIFFLDILTVQTYLQQISRSVSNSFLQKDTKRSCFTLVSRGSNQAVKQFHHIWRIHKVESICWVSSTSSSRDSSSIPINDASPFKSSLPSSSSSSSFSSMLWSRLMLFDLKMGHVPCTVVLRFLLLFPSSFRSSSLSLTDITSTELTLLGGIPSGWACLKAAGPVSLLRFIRGECVGDAIGDRNMQTLLGATEAAMSITEGWFFASLLLVKKKQLSGFGISVFGVNSNSLDFWR